MTVPNGVTVEGGGHVITATDPDATTSFNGGVVTNAQGPGAHLMHVNNVIIQAVGFAFHGCAFQTPGPNVQVGLFFDDADGTATDVTVRNITQHSGCQTGNGIRANARAGTARTVTLTHVTVTGYMKNGITGSGQMTLNVGGNSTIGPPDALPGLNTTNGVQYGDGGAGGTFTGNTVIGAGAGTPPDGTNSTGILLSSAANVTIANNTITGAGTDLGIGVPNSTNVTISNNAVGRTAPDSPDPTGTGIVVFPSATNVALICNTFSGWQPNRNIVGAVQMSCTPLPNGCESQAYSADIFSVEGGTAPFTWSVSAGTLPPGLTLAPSTGAITGTPTGAGTYNFTLRVVDSTGLTATQAQTITIADCAPPPTTTTPPIAADSSGQDRHRQDDTNAVRVAGRPGHVPDHRQKPRRRAGQRAAGVRPGAARAEVRAVHGAYASRSGPPTVRRDQLAAAGSAPDIPRHLPAAHQRYEGQRHQPRERGPRPGHRHDRSAARPGLPGGGERPRARSLLRRSRGRRAAISVARRPSGQLGDAGPAPALRVTRSSPFA